MVYPYVRANGGTDSSLDIVTNLQISQISLNTVGLSVSVYGLGSTPSRYTVKYAMIRFNGREINTPSYTTVSSNTLPVTITNLVLGGTYSFELRAYKTVSGTEQFGDAVVREYFVPLTAQSASVANNGANNAAATGTGTGAQELSAGKSFLKISNSAKSKNSYSIVYKSFAGVETVGKTQVPVVGPNGVTENAPAYASTKYYSFGTTLYMDEIVTQPQQAAGFGFFISDSGNSGYYVLIDTTAKAAKNNAREVRIVKVSGADMIDLTANQNPRISSLNGVYGGRAYTIDVKVKVSNQQVRLVVYINGFKITATDTFAFPNASNKKGSPLLDITKNVALACGAGTAFFDYVYAINLDETKFNSDNEKALNVYQGQFSNDTISFLYGDLLYNQNLSGDAITQKGVAIEEFGTVAREIKKTKIKFDNRPGNPIRFSTADNKYAKVLGSKLTSFGGESYVLNNTSAYVALDDGEYSSYYVLGNTIGKSGQLEYATEDPGEYVTKEPIVFESNWIQTESDAKALADWIKTNAVNKGKVIELVAFGNPLISIGDIVAINYDYQNLAGTEKFIVTSVRHNFEEGLETTLTCRSL
jgi:hypothetical protein